MMKGLRCDVLPAGFVEPWGNLIYQRPSECRVWTAHRLTAHRTPGPRFTNALICTPDLEAADRGYRLETEASTPAFPHSGSEPGIVRGEIEIQLVIAFLGPGGQHQNAFLASNISQMFQAIDLLRQIPVLDRPANRGRYIKCETGMNLVRVVAHVLDGEP